MIDRHSPLLIRVIRAHKRIPGGRIVRLSAPPFAGISNGYLACAFLEIRAVRVKRERKEGEGRGLVSYLRALSILTEAPVADFDSVPRFRHAPRTRKRSRSIASNRDFTRVPRNKEVKKERWRSLLYFFRKNRRENNVVLCPSLTQIRFREHIVLKNFTYELIFLYLKKTYYIYIDL